MQRVTKELVLGAEELELIRGDVAAARKVAAERVASCPPNLRGEREGAKADQERRARILDAIQHAVRVTFTVPENPEGEG